MQINAKITPPSALFVKAKSALMAEIEKEIRVQGRLLETGAKVNAGNQGIKDSGGLINSIKATYTDLRVVVGTTKAYGKINEFGGRITPAQKRAMFARLAERGRRARDTQGGKGVIEGLDWKPRPYLLPAFNERIDDMKKRIDIIIKNASK